MSYLSETTNEKITEEDFLGELVENTTDKSKAIGKEFNLYYMKKKCIDVVSNMIKYKNKSDFEVFMTTDAYIIYMMLSCHRAA